MDNPNFEYNLNNAKEVLDKLEESGNFEISYGSLAFWIAVVMKCEEVPDNISLADFFEVLTGKPHKAATVSIKEQFGG